MDTMLVIDYSSMHKLKKVKDCEKINMISGGLIDIFRH